VTSYDKLDSAGQGVIKLFGLIGAAWLATNVLVAASPLYRLIALFTALSLAIGLLVDDYETFNRGGKSFFDWSGNVIPNLKLIATGLGAVLAGFIAFKVVTGILGLVNGALIAVRATMATLALVTAMNPFVLIFAGMVAGMMLAYGIYQMFSTEITDFFHETIPAAFDVVNGVFQAMIAGVIEFAVWIRQAIGEGIDWIVARFWAIIAVISGVFSSALASVINFVVMLKQWISDGVEYIKEKFNAGVEVIKGVFSNLAADIINSMVGVLDFFGGMWDSIKNGASDALGAVGRMTGGGVPFASTSNSQVYNFAFNKNVDSPQLRQDAVLAFGATNRNFVG
jgi:hypothetical protein